MKILKNEKHVDIMQNYVKFVFIYTCFFMIALLIVTYRHFLSGRTFIWLNDPWWQHYKAYIYIQSFYKKIITNLIQTHSINIPLWDMTIGEGSDIINAFCYYGLTDPFNIIGFLIPSDHILISYHIMIVSKMYFAGISFACMCNVLIKNRVRINIIIGSLLYAFCSWNLYNMRRHHMFMNSLIFVPLVITGIEKVINSKKTILITIGIFLISISNLYYLYVSTIIIGVYTLIRVLLLTNVLLKRRITIILQVMLMSIFGILISSFISLSSAYYFLNDARKNVHFDILLFYPKEYYINFIKNLIMTTQNSFWLICGFGAISVVAIIHLFISKKRYTEKTLFVISVIFMLFPIFGQMFNAFSYVSNKWVWAVSILVNFIICNTVNYIFTSINKSLYKKFFVFAFILLTYYTIFINSNYLNDEKIDNNYMNCVKAEDAKNWVLYDEAEFIKEYKDKINDKTFSRYDTDYEDWNNGMLKETPNISYYWTLSNKHLVDFKKTLYDRESWINVFTNYDNRIILDALSLVKYYVHDKNKPLSIKNIKRVWENNGFDIFEKQNFLDISYVYNKFIKRTDFDKLNIGEKEIILLNTCVLNENANTKFINTYSFDFSKSLILFEQKDGYLNTKLDNNYISIAVDNTRINNQNYEYTLVFENLNYIGKEEATNLSIFGDNDYLNNIVYHNKTHQHYTDTHNFAVNLKKDMIDNITIFFDEKGEYTYDSLYLIALPIDYINESLNKLKETVVNNITVNKDSLSGEVYANEDGMLVFSIPYTKFWKVIIDGKEVEYFNANLKNIGIYIHKGRHDVKIVYKNTLFDIGVIVSIIILAIFIVKETLIKYNIS